MPLFLHNGHLWYFSLSWKPRGTSDYFMPKQRFGRCVSVFESEVYVCISLLAGRSASSSHSWLWSPLQAHLRQAGHCSHLRSTLPATPPLQDSTSEPIWYRPSFVSPALTLLLSC